MSILLHFRKTFHPVNLIAQHSKGTDYAKGTSSATRIVPGETVAASVYCPGSHKNPLADRKDTFSWGQRV